MGYVLIVILKFSNGGENIVASRRQQQDSLNFQEGILIPIPKVVLFLSVISVELTLWKQKVIQLKLKLKLR